jgi:hypothetical protein
MKFTDYLQEKAVQIEEVLDKTLPESSLHPSVLHESMRYSTLGGGKRLRAILVLAACETVGGDPRQAYGVAAALEMIHAYSLVQRGPMDAFRPLGPLAALVDALILGLMRQKGLDAVEQLKRLDDLRERYGVLYDK